MKILNQPSFSMKSLVTLKKKEKHSQLLQNIPQRNSFMEVFLQIENCDRKDTHLLHASRNRSNKTSLSISPSNQPLRGNTPPRQQTPRVRKRGKGEANHSN
ncbi:hypothetical protein CDAR_48691 [Caerostris darwini]|uniref:Uncharacterized protein n=1 Tax=Caerostris darwini TaxID=1538125 RepID=A0AAV4NHN0_9ARAC|nr:hypothetical protein CDAR_48691 [Caerostris darwini]